MGESFRNWRKRGQVTLSNGPAGNGTWTSFTAADLTKLAFMREMLRFGFPVEVADRIAHAILADEDLWAEDLPVQSYWKAFSGFVIAIGNNPGAKRWPRTKFPKDGTIPFSGTTLFIDAELIIKEVFDRAFDALADREKRRRA